MCVTVLQHSVSSSRDMSHCCSTMFVIVIFASVFMILACFSNSDSRFNHCVCVFSSLIFQTMFVIGCFPFRILVSIVCLHIFSSSIFLQCRFHRKIFIFPSFNLSGCVVLCLYLSVYACASVCVVLSLWVCRVSLWVCWFSHREHFRRARSHLSVCVCVCVCLKIVCRRSCSFSRVCAVLWLFVFEVLFACFHLFCVWGSCVSGCVCVCSGCLSVGACACACARVCRRRTRNVTVFFHVICFSRFFVVCGSHF